MLSITPLAGLQTACHARLPESQGLISSVRDLISRAMQPRFYMRRVKPGMSISFRRKPHLLRRDVCSWAALFRFYKSTTVPLEFIRSPVHLVGMCSPSAGRLRRTVRYPDGAVDLFAPYRAWDFAIRRSGISRCLKAKMPFYRAYIVGLHDRPIGVVQLDCTDDESAIKSAARLVDSHDVELWQMDRSVARFDARSKQMCKK